MSKNALTRQVHRWFGILLTLTVLANFAAMVVGKPPLWMVYAPLGPLAVLVATGVYLFVLPHGGAGVLRSEHDR